MDLTIIVKTFNRKTALVRFLESVVSYYPHLPIIIADDSRRPYKEEILKKFNTLNLEYHILPFDTGLSKGRNFLLSKVKTKYFLLCDDDFEFDERSNIENCLEVLIETKVDIIGGAIYNIVTLDTLYSYLWCLKKPSRFLDVIRKKEFKAVYNGQINRVNQNCTVTVNKNYDSYEYGSLYDSDIVLNFFIANTDTIKKLGGWIPETAKVGEHEVFFIRAKEFGVKVRYLHGFGIKHYPQKKMNYNRYRIRNKKMREEALLYCGIQNFDIIESNNFVLKGEQLQ